MTSQMSKSARSSNMSMKLKSLFKPPAQPAVEIAVEIAVEMEEYNPETLCSQCQSIRLKHWLSPRAVRFLYKLPDEYDFDPPLTVSPSSRCALCRLLSHSLGQSGTVTKLRFRDHGDTQTFEGFVTTSVSMSAGSNASRDEGLRILPLGKSAFRVSSGRYSYARTLEPEAASRNAMKKWIHVCQHSHTRCQELEKKVQRLPMRCTYLIDVRNMCVSPVNEDTRRYFALSYVWGQVTNLQLLKNNVDELSKPSALRSCFDSLPKVIQDAITITQELGESFLWVDSLCICQDDSVNKHLQIAHMNRIYQNATATLVAIDSADAGSGLPGVRPYPKSRTQHIERVHHMQMTSLLPDVHNIQGVYSTRAWTYQEEVFSRRLLYFTNNQVQFRCLKTTCSEDTHEGDPGFPYGRTGQLYGLYPYTEFTWWQKTVTEYSTRVYSFDEDRYEAFEGISNELAESWNYHCIWGMPIVDIVAALCWKHRHEASKRIWLHPSWSWCGWTNGVWFLGNDTPLFSMIELLEDMPSQEHVQLDADITYRRAHDASSKNAPSTQPLILKFFAYSALIVDAAFTEGDVECILIASHDDSYHAMLIDSKGDHHERIGILKLRKEQFWDYHPLCRLIHLG